MHTYTVIHVTTTPRKHGTTTIERRRAYSPRDAVAPFRGARMTAAETEAAHKANGLR